MKSQNLEKWSKNQTFDYSEGHISMENNYGITACAGKLSVKLKSQI